MTSVPVINEDDTMVMNLHMQDDEFDLWSLGATNSTIQHLPL